MNLLNSEIKALQKTLNFWEFGAKKIPYCGNCKSFERVTCRKESGGLTRYFKCDECGKEEKYTHKAFSPNHI